MTGEPAEASAPTADAAGAPAAAPVFGDLVGQESVVAQLSAAAAGAASASSAQTALAMTHAWLFTGPPGSGRSVAARAFAAALLCANQGCGQCPSCRQVAAGSHADLLLVRPDGLSYGVRQTRSLVLRAAAAPVSGRWRVVLFEDADRATEQAANALLKAIEDPRPGPSGCSARRHRTTCPPRSGPDAGWSPCARRPRMRSLQCSPLRGSGRTKRWPRRERRRGTSAGPAGWPPTRRRRRGGPRYFRYRCRCRRPARWRPRLRARRGGEAGQGGGERSRGADRRARRARTRGPPQGVRRRLHRQGGRGRRPRRGRCAEGTEDRQKSRATRLKRDALDRALLDLASFYRDVLAVQFGADVELANDAQRRELEQVASAGPPGHGAPDRGDHGVPERLAAALPHCSRSRKSPSPSQPAEPLRHGLCRTRGRPPRGS